jgi:hypothetical protein
MKFDINADTPKLTFKPISYLDNDAFMNAMEKGKSEAAKRCVTMTVAPPKASQAAIAAPKPTAAPAPAPEAKVEAAESEPVVVKAKKEEAAPAPKADMSSILSTWDDEE